jgi:flagellar biosynthetic protein FlhB
MGMFQDSLILIAKATFPIFAVGAVGAIVLNVGQGGLVLTSQPLKPKMSRINPLAGLKRLFSPNGGVQLAKSIAKMVIIGIVVYMVLKGQMDRIVGLGAQSIPDATVSLATLSFDIALKSAMALFLLGVADYAWQRRQFLSQLTMTKEELKQEMKESDGDPHIKAAIRRRRHEMLNRMMAAVPNADIVVTNPTHYAVAIKYDPLTMAAPMVVAKGEQFLAQRIKEVAKQNGVPVLEEPPLARALYAAVQVGHPVPANLYRAVAEVLAWLYALRERRPFRWQRTGD